MHRGVRRPSENYGATSSMRNGPDVPLAWVIRAAKSSIVSARAPSTPKPLAIETQLRSATLASLMPEGAIVVDDPEQAYFANGIVEDIIAGLSRLGWLSGRNEKTPT
jgi:hypothetical protein